MNLIDAIRPFAELVKSTSGRIPVEKLSFEKWHNLIKAYEEARRMNYPLENNFTYHAPKEGQQEKYVALRAKAKELAALILELVPQSREQSVALTELETSIFWANAGIARNS